MKAVFADASFYIAWMNPRDEFHTEADRLAENYFGEIFTSEYVLIEVGNWLSRATDKSFFVQLLDYLKEDPQTRIIPASPELFREGFWLFSQRTDKDWSMTDCISFYLMKEKGIQEAFSSDHHFEQAGYRILLPVNR
jgi:predicted nucleic acid-binding protein